MKRLFLVAFVATVFLVFVAWSEAENTIDIGYGWSTKADVTGAVKEAVASVRGQLGGATPDYAILFSTVGYDVNVVLDEVNRAFGPDTKIFGETSCLGVVTNDGFHIGKVGSLALLGISSDRVSFGIGACSLNEVPDPKEAARKAISEAIKDAGKERRELPDLVLVAPCAVGNEEKLLAGIEAVLGKGKVPIFGGAAADNTIKGYWKVFANERVYSNAIALTAIYTDLKLGYAFLSGFTPTDKKAIATEAEGRVIIELDHRPAGEVYNEWVDCRLTDELLNSAENILLATNLDPLGKKMLTKAGITPYLLVHPKSFPKTPEHSLEVFADVKKGDEFTFLRGSREMLVERAALTARLARSRGRITEKEVAGGLFIYCAGTMLAIPAEDRPQITSKINEALGGAPFIGVFTFGEQGFFPGIGNLHGNLMSSAIIFGKE